MDDKRYVLLKKTDQLFESSSRNRQFPYLPRISFRFRVTVRKVLIILIFFIAFLPLIWITRYEFT